MKITRKQLQRVVKEEVQRYLSEGDCSYGARDEEEPDQEIIDQIKKDLPPFEPRARDGKWDTYPAGELKPPMDPESKKYERLLQKAMAEKYGEDRKAEKASKGRFERRGKG